MIRNKDKKVKQMEQLHIDRLNETTEYMFTHSEQHDQKKWHCGTAHCWGGFGDLLEADRRAVQIEGEGLNFVDPDYYGVTEQVWMTITKASNTREQIKLFVAAAIKGNGEIINLTNADLRGVDLSDTDLTNTNLSGANLTDASLSRADLRDANLSSANLGKADLNSADLTGADLHDADLTGADLYVAYLSYANLTGANLTGADLTKTVLSGANLTNTNLFCAKLTGANLRGANFTGTDLNWCQFN